MKYKWKKLSIFKKNWTVSTDFLHKKVLFCSLFLSILSGLLLTSSYFAGSWGVTINQKNNYNDTISKENLLLNQNNSFFPKSKFNLVTILFPSSMRSYRLLTLNNSRNNVFVLHSNSLYFCIVLAYLTPFLTCLLPYAVYSQSMNLFYLLHFGLFISLLNATFFIIYEVKFLNSSFTFYEVDYPKLKSKFNRGLSYWLYLFGALVQIAANLLMIYVIVQKQRSKCRKQSLK